MTNLIELEEKVLELERYKRKEEQDRTRDLAQRKRELLSARRQVQTEIKRANAKVRQTTAEVEALEKAVWNTQEKEERAIERQMRLNVGFQKACAGLDARSTEMTTLLQDKMVALGKSRGRLAQLQSALRTLETDLFLPVEFEALLQDPEAVEANAAQRQPSKGLELTAALRREAEELRDKEKRLKCENDMLQEELKEVRRIFELGEKVHAAPPPLESPAFSLSRATTTATSGNASPAISKFGSAVSPPGGLSASSSTVKLYSASPQYVPHAASVVASAVPIEPSSISMMTSSIEPSSQVSYTVPSRYSSAVRHSSSDYPTLPVAPVVSSYPAPGVFANQSSPWMWPCRPTVTA